MKELLKIVAKLFIGFFLCGLGIVFMINSNLGAGPWDVFHQGLSNNTFLTIGQANIAVGVILVGITTLFKLKIGLGTALNMIFIGVFTDIIIFTDLVPVGSGLLSGVVMLTFGMFFMSLGTYLYLSCEMGCGPRDGLMVVLTVLTKKPVNIIRRSIEFGALIIGVLLGGKVGIGTFVIAFGLGGFMKLIFEFCNFDVSNAEHLAFKDTFGYVKDLIEAEKNEKVH